MTAIKTLESLESENKEISPPKIVRKATKVALKSTEFKSPAI